ncbi:maleylpyruvate isomerase family mycothiol-dependent enzyme [Nocardioides sp. YIM 152588]|uniref:maleylpyruvate isomerase family mycothiol-dependent enzyme n=1 Tax=Nocardioides sp. YIM 152588 TaxID=3158259 RepID=UPI0032E3A27C
MSHTLETRIAWAAEGTGVVTTAVAALGEEEMSAPSVLPGWSRKHVVAHVALNAEALGRLTHWARTGEPTPMYVSREQRAADIEAGAQRPAAELAEWAAASAAALADAWAELTDKQWRAEVVTRGNRTITADLIPWLRSREVWIHAVDLGADVGFADLPEPFLAALVEEIRDQRDLAELPEGPLPEVAAYLSGRPHALVGVPDLGAWL